MNLSQTIKEQVSLSRAAEHLGIHITNAGRRDPCPWCGSSTGFKVTRDQYFRCYRCDSQGSVFDLVIKSGRADNFKSALSWLADTFNIQSTNTTSSPTALDVLWDTVLAKHNVGQVQEWLVNGRGIPEDLVIKHSLTDYFTYWHPNQLQDHDLYRCFNNRYIAAIKDLTGHVVHLTGRAKAEIEPRWMHSKGTPAINNYLWGLDQVKYQEQDYVILCEGVTDGISLKALGEPVVSCFGVNIPLVHHAWALRNLSHIVIVLDRDKYPLGSDYAGQYKSWSKMLPNLVELAGALPNTKLFCCMVPNWSGVKDINDFMKAIDWDLVEFKRYLANNAMTLTTMAVELVLQSPGGSTPKQHGDLWKLLRGDNYDASAVALLKQYVEQSEQYRGDWARYIADLPLC